MKGKQLLPDEYRKVGLVEVMRQGLEGEATVEGIELISDFYVVEVRRFDKKWLPTRVYSTSLLDTGELPNDVLERIFRYRKTILSEERSQTAKDRAAERRNGHTAEVQLD